jgi:hypothetical protein
MPRDPSPQPTPRRTYFDSQCGRPFSCWAHVERRLQPGGEAPVDLLGDGVRAERLLGSPVKREVPGPIRVRSFNGTTSRAGLTRAAMSPRRASPPVRTWVSISSSASPAVPSPSRAFHTRRYNGKCANSTV